MKPVQKALWFIESEIRNDFSLRDVAHASGVSSHYLIRAFGKSVGMPVMRYVKARCLSEAAKALAGGAPDIMTVAMLAGYQSHEAFTRAFSDQFGRSPNQVRDLRTTSVLPLVEPLMLDDHRGQLPEPKIEEHQNITITGFSQRFDEQSKATIPSLWRELEQYLDREDGQLGTPTYGVCWNFEESGAFDYLCGLDRRLAESAHFQGENIAIPAGVYATFLHTGHISSIRSSWSAIYDSWLPNSGYQLANSPELERYSADFDPVGGRGCVSIQIPLKAA